MKRIQEYNNLIGGIVARNANEKHDADVYAPQRRAEAVEYVKKHPACAMPTRFGLADFVKEKDVSWRFVDFVMPSPGFPVYRDDYTIIFDREAPAADPDRACYRAFVQVARPNFCFGPVETGGLGRLVDLSHGQVYVSAREEGRNYDNIYNTGEPERRPPAKKTKK